MMINRRLAAIAMMLVLALGLSVSWTKTVVKASDPTGKVVVMLTPVNQTVSPNTSVNITLTLDPRGVTDITGTQFVLTYPSDANDFTFGSFDLDPAMSSGGWQKQFAGQKIVGNDEQISFAATHNGPWTASSPVTFAKLTLNAKSATSKTLIFDQVLSKVTSGANAVDVLLTPTSTATVDVSSPVAPPTAPTGLTATSVKYNTVSLSWKASTSSIGIGGYYVVRNNVTIGKANLTSYTDNSVSPSSTYSYQVVAFDTAGTSSLPSSSVSVTTPATPDTTPPTVPGNLSGTAVSDKQINLSWTASTDNVGVAGYNVYRNGSKVATITSTSYGDTGLLAGTSYIYYVTSFDAAGNLSSPSNKATISTLNPTATGAVTGIVSSSKSELGISGAKVTLFVNKKNRIRAMTSLSGAYMISGVKPGTYRIEYTAKSFVRQSSNVAVSSNLTTIKNISLVSRR